MCMNVNDYVVSCIIQQYENINHQGVVFFPTISPFPGTVCSAMAELSSSIYLGGRPLNMDTQPSGRAYLGEVSTWGVKHG